MTLAARLHRASISTAVAKRTLFFGLVALLLQLAAARPLDAQILTPESPEVVDGIKKGLAFLADKTERRPGGRALVGIAFLKQGTAHDHPKIVDGLDAVREIIAAEKPYNEEIYSMAVAIIFLVSLDPKEHRGDIEVLLRRLISKQKGHGGWGYPNWNTGDTSMTQYAVLCMWECAQFGIDSPVEAWERVANWLLLTQDPDGAFGYQGQLAPGIGQRVPQTEKRLSMSAAGLGSLYICQDFLGSSGPAPDQKKVPVALRRSEKEKKRGTMNVAEANKAQELGREWWEKEFKPIPRQYAQYYLYAFERYKSFEELVTNQIDEAPTWYDTCARAVLKAQRPSGAWGSGSDTGEQCDTAFAILFLLRSTKKSMQKANRFGAGKLAGGRGLPTDATSVELNGGNLQAKPLRGPAEELLKLLEDPDNPEQERAAEGFAELAMEADEATLNKHAAKLKKLAGSANPEARLAAVRGLARSRNLDNVPVLIYALTDPDVRVFQEAREGLRFLSRKFDGLGDEGVPDEAKRREEIARWKAWYLSIRPDAKFED